MRTATFILDVENPTRQWAEIIPDGKLCRLKKDEMADWHPDADLNERCILVVHWGALHLDCDAVVLERWVQSHLGLHIVVISGAGMDGRTSSARVYYRKTAVGLPNDVAFERFFRRFRAKLESGVVDFGLLEPDALPDHLVGAYLVALAAEANLIGPDDIEGLLLPAAWAAAREEYEQVQLPDAEHPCDSSAEVVPTLARLSWPAEIFPNGKPISGLLRRLRSALRVDDDVPPNSNAGD